jgi:ribosomal protein S18 acetylase RimI-like enzyme
MSGAPVSSRKRDPVSVRVAAESDLAIVLEILTEAAAWSKRRGVEDRWQVPFPESVVRPNLLRGEVYLAHASGGAVGTLTLMREDLKFWGEQPPIAGYVHRLAVRRSIQHRGVGARLLDWAATEVAGWGRSRLRLDCVASNGSLVGYYLSLGFRKIRTVEAERGGERFVALLMERPIIRE